MHVFGLRQQHKTNVKIARGMYKRKAEQQIPSA
jgi:hypothetical protein